MEGGNATIFHEYYVGLGFRKEVKSSSVMPVYRETKARLITKKLRKEGSLADQVETN